MVVYRKAVVAGALLILFRPISRLSRAQLLGYPTLALQEPCLATRLNVKGSIPPAAVRSRA